MEPEILDIRGKQIELLLWRETDNLFEATLEDADGNPVNLVDSSVVMTVVDRNGGTVKFLQTNTSADHTDAANGVTRFFIPRAPTFDGLEGTRAYTWKYQVVRIYTPSGARNVYFWGDARVFAPAADV